MIGPSKITYQQETDSQDQQSRPISIKSNHQFQSNQNPDQKSFFDLGIPVDAFAVIKGHQKSVSCLEVDPKGHRLATGSLDYNIRLWDFHGMNRNMNSFRIVEPFAGNAIRNVHFNKSGTHLMVICGGKQVAMLDKDGGKSLFTVKGYMYVKQLNQTKGHTNTIYDGQFHPQNANQFATASGDGSIRLWDLQQKLEGIQKELGHKILLKCRNQKNTMTKVTGLGYTADAKMVFGGCEDGSLQGFSTKHNLHRPQILIRDAHRPMEEYSAVLSYPDSSKIITRNSDATMKVWDLRKYEKPYAHYSNLPNNFPGSKICWSPNGKILVVGTSIGYEQQEKQSYLHFYDGPTLDRLKTINMGPVSVNGVSWSPAINQLLIGTSDSQAKIYFDSRLSTKGALQCVNKKPRIDKDPNFDYSHPVYLPFSLPIYKERPTNNRKKDIQEARKSQVATMKPFMPQQGPNKGGGEVYAFTPIQHMIKSLNQNLEQVDDARKKFWEIQKHGGNKKEYTMAYQLTQPHQLFSENPRESKEFQLLHTIEKICPHCGLKMCTCATKHIMDSQQEEDVDDKAKEWR